MYSEAKASSASSHFGGTLSVLKQEWEYYLAHQNEWVEKAPGRYVLIHGEEVVGFYERFSEAVNDGYRRLGHVPFLVRRLLLEAPLIQL